MNKNKRNLPNWEDFYKTSSPDEIGWDYYNLDNDIAEAVQFLPSTHKNVLDIGAGTGRQAIALSKLGYNVLVTDISRSALELCRQNAITQQTKVQIQLDDITNTNLLIKFDLIIDRGCFHILEPMQYDNYINSLKKLAAPEAYLFLKCFSDKEKVDFHLGPYRFSENNICQIFKEFKIEKIIHSQFYCEKKYQPKALFSIIRLN